MQYGIVCLLIEYMLHQLQQLLCYNWENKILWQLENEV